ncbi:hypothetical protein KKI24_03375 [bacterium]|nr:hypothetical protein [bacterium]
MKNRLVYCLLTIFTVTLFTACTPAYRLQSGTYRMSLKHAPTVPNEAQTVMVTVEDSRITIKNPASNRLLTGQLDGNRFSVSSREDTQSVDFTGVLSSDNQVEGTAVQKEGEKTLFSGTFLMVPVK